MTSRWDALFDQKPIPLIEHLLDEISRLLAKDLASWPPPVHDVDPLTGSSAAAVLSPDAKAPPREAFLVALELARFELRREVDAFDDYLRNRRYLSVGLAEADRPAILFLTRWLVEQMLSLGESTDGRVTRARMQECLDRIERRLRPSAS